MTMIQVELDMERSVLGDDEECEGAEGQCDAVLVDFRRDGPISLLYLLSITHPTVVPTLMEKTKQKLSALEWNGKEMAFKAKVYTTLKKTDEMVVVRITKQSVPRIN